LEKARKTKRDGQGKQADGLHPSTLRANSRPGVERQNRGEEQMTGNPALGNDTDAGSLIPE